MVEASIACINAWYEGVRAAAGSSKQRIKTRFMLFVGMSLRRLRLFIWRRCRRLDGMVPAINRGRCRGFMKQLNLVPAVPKSYGTPDLLRLAPYCR